MKSKANHQSVVIITKYYTSYLDMACDKVLVHLIKFQDFK